MNFDFNKSIILENERVLIRPMEAADKGFFSDFLLDSSLNKYSSMEINNSQDAIQYIEDCLVDRKNGVRYPFIFFDKKSKTYAGTSCYGNVSNSNKRLEIGWTKIGKHFQGTGLNAHCKKLMLEYAFESLNYNRVELKAHAGNIASRKAMEKIGATFEGLLRNHSIMPNGSLRDTVYYSILKEEWPSIKTENTYFNA